MCAKDDLIRQKSLLRLAGELAIAESITAKDSNHVNIFSLDFAFSFANILLLIAFIISYCLFADKLNIQQSLLDRVTVVLIIILVNKIQLLLILEDRSTPSTLLARFIPITKIRNLFLKTLENVAKFRILLACVDRRIRQCYLTICAILANYEEQVLLTSIKKNCYCMRCTKHYNFNIYVSLATDTLHLLLKGLVIKMLDFMQDITSLKRFNNKRAFTELIAVVSLLFISKAPFALHFIYAVCNLHALIYIIQDIRMYRALNSICTRANSEAYYITIVKQFYSIINKKEYILQIYRKYIAYIRAFSKVLLFNNNRQINNTTRILSVPFKFYDLSTIICLVHLVLRDLPNLITYTTISYYVNNYIN
ncbi:hypothetical protein HBH71_175950 [Parastagonospora nodorum]|nr:hypothetical protein HBH71_175950 [Parastagonospora nodorum]